MFHIRFRFKEIHHGITGEERAACRAAVAGSRSIGPSHPDERFEVTVRLRACASLSSKVKTDAMSARSPKGRNYLTREQLAAALGAAPEDITKVTAFA